jgi:hypothetical protein
LAQAVIDHDNAVLKVKDDTEALKKAQDDAAADVAYHTAIDNVANAQVAVDAANQKVRSSTDALHAIQNGSLEQNLEEAILRLKDAYIAQATAEANLQIDQDALNGQFDTAAQKAQILSDKLREVGLTANPLVSGDILALADQIGGASGQLDTMTGAAQGVGSTIAQNVVPPVQDLHQHLQDLRTKTDDANTGFFGWVEGGLAAFTNWLSDNIPGVSQLEGMLVNIGNTITGNNISGTTNIGQLGSIVKGLGYSQGGYFDRPTVGVFGEDGPEVILPLTKPDRMMELLSQTGVMDMLNTKQLAGAGVVTPALVGVGASGDTHYHEGDQFHLTSISHADPEDIINEYFWARRTRPA